MAKKPTRKAAKSSARKPAKKVAKKTAKKATSKKATSKKATPKKAASKARGKVKATTSKAAMSAGAPKIRTASRPRNTKSNSYTFSEFVENVRGFCGLQKRSEAKEVVEDIAAFVRDSLRRGYKIPLLGLGKIYVRETKAREGRNPATGETIRIPARKRVRFTPAKSLKESVLR